MSRPIEARISASALRENYAAARRAAPRSGVLAVVKANGYGHGLLRVARALGAVDGFGLIEPEGALELRQSGHAGPIVLLEGFFEARELPELARAGIATAVHCEEQLRMLEDGRVAPLDVWVKLNTGMNRLGFPERQARAVVERLRRSGRARSLTLMTHFATADSEEGIAQAVARFEAATRGLELPRTLANTAALFAHPESHAGLVRLGIGLYGATPFADRTARALGLRPAMTLASRLIAVQALQRGDAVGYGATFRAPAAMRIGVVACGYGDGYPRHAPGGTPVLVDGVRVPTVGRVSMDMLTVDLTAVPHAGVGTSVELWGPRLPVDEVAAAAGTIGYELLCAVAPRVRVVEGP